MYELIFKNHLKTFFLLLITIAALSGISLVSFAYVEIPLPVYILGILTGFLALSFIIHSKATIGQTLQVSIAGILINSVSLAGVYLANSYLNLPEIILKPDFVLSLNPLLTGASFLFSIIVLCSAVKLEEIKKTEINPGEETINNKNREITEDKPLSKQDDLQDDTEVVKFNFTEKQKSEDQEENGKEQKTPCTYEELYPQGSKYLKVEDAEEEIDLEDIPQSDLKLTEKNLEKTEEETSCEYDKLSENPENMDFIPTDIRLTETPAAKETESRGRIASIGKLLVNNRDIENLIETNETSENSAVNDRTNIISSISGEKIYNKFSNIKGKFKQIKEVALIDKGGFILANDFEDKQKAQMTGALVSGAYHTLHNYLAQISLSFPVRIFFETANTNSFIVKTRDEVLFSTWDKEFKHVEYGPLSGLIEADDFSGIDIKPFSDLIKIDDFIIVDMEGNIINSQDSALNPQKFAAVSSAIFENLKVFLMNVQLLKLSKIVVFTPEKVMTIAKSHDKIVSLLTPQEEFPRISEELLKMEEIY